MDVTIRPECGADIDAIGCVTEQAFLDHPHSQQTEAFIIAALRGNGALSVSLVAESGGEIVGHIAFSPVVISGGGSNWYALGPLSVAPEAQGRGIGQALVKAGLSALRGLPSNGCVVVGEPGYYGRFGFRSDPHCTMNGIPQVYVQVLPFGAEMARGNITHDAAFHARS